MDHEGICNIWVLNYEDLRARSRTSACGSQWLFIEANCYIVTLYPMKGNEDLE